MTTETNMYKYYTAVPYNTLTFSTADSLKVNKNNLLIKKN